MTSLWCGVETVLKRWTLRRLAVLTVCICGVLLITVNFSTTLPTGSTAQPHRIDDHSCLFPECNRDSDRILQQLYYRPDVVSNRTFTIFLADPLKIWSVQPGYERFRADDCPLQNCFVTDEKRIASTADAVLFRNELEDLRTPRPLHQVWILYLLESPLNTKSFQSYNRLVNWTATYRQDSDLVVPYAKFVTFNDLKKFTKADEDELPLGRNYAEGKKRKVAWFVSNCGTKNRRLQYANQLAKYIKVDIYGRCSDKDCPHGPDCLEMIQKDFKFYLSFENSNCRDYITEKLYTNALQNDVIPIVMGATRKQYESAAPHHSFIHVEDFKSPKELASYLKLLDRNDSLYNEYFQWKSTGRWINTKFWCRLCALLNAPRVTKFYPNFEQWWRGSDTCVKDKWNRSDPIARRFD